MPFDQSWYGAQLALLLTIAALLAGCPGQTPPADQFAHATAADGGAAGDVAARAAADAAAAAGDVGSDQLAPDTAALDTVATDVASSAQATCVATNGLGLFAKTLDNGANDLVQAMAATSDGGAVLVGKTGNGGSQTDVWAVRTSALGAKIWAKTYGDSQEEDGRAVVVTATGFAIAGLTRSKGAGSGDGWLVRIDGDGKVIGDKTYGGTSLDEFAGIAATQDGGLIMAGSNRSLGGGLADGWLVRTDGEGNVLWQFKYGGSQIDDLYAVIALPDGRFAAAGATSSKSTGGADAWLLVVDAKGAEVLSKPFGLGDNDDARALAATADGGFVLTGGASANGNPELWTLKIDGDGGLLWKDIATGNQGESGRAVVVWPDGAIAVVGETNSNFKDGSAAGYDGWLLRYDNWGNRLWDKRFGDSGNQWLAAAVALPDHGVLMGGRLFANGGFDGWLVRADAWGNADCSAMGACKSKSAADCDDGLPCTVDRCDSIDGCTHTALAAGSACGKGGLCNGTACN